MGENFLVNQDQVKNIKRPWYKSGVGIVFLSVISLVIIGAIIFMAFFGYYLWQVKYGDAEKLAKQFETNNFSAVKQIEVSDFSNKQKVNSFDDIIRDYNPTFGNKESNVAIVFFIDFECPFCQQDFPIFKQVMQKYESAVKFVFKNLPLEAIHPNSVLAAQAGACAHEQGKFWDYYNFLFERKELSKEKLVSYAEELSLNTNSFNLCLSSEKYKNNIDQDLLDGVDSGLRGTPTYIINGYKVEGAVSRDDWDKIILQFLKTN